MLRKLIDMPLPEPCGRFYLPVVQTSLKEGVLSGLYDDEVSEAEEGVKKFASKFLTASKPSDQYSILHSGKQLNQTEWTRTNRNENAKSPEKALF